MSFKMPCMVDKTETLKRKQREAIDALRSCLTILKSDLKDLGYKCTDSSIVQSIDSTLKLHQVWKASVYHLSETVAKVKPAKIQLQLGKPSPVVLVQITSTNSRSGRGGRTERGRDGERRQWQSPAKYEAKAKRSKSVWARVWAFCTQLHASSSGRSPNAADERFTF